MSIVIAGQKVTVGQVVAIVVGLLFFLAIMSFSSYSDAEKSRESFASLTQTASGSVSQVDVRKSRRSSLVTVKLDVTLQDGKHLACSINGAYTRGVKVGDNIDIRTDGVEKCASTVEIDTLSSVLHYLPLVGGIVF